AAAQEPFDVRAHYTKREVMIPMRDGVKLFTILYEPKDRSQTYPFLLVRTPYSIPPYEPDQFREPLGPSPEFDRDGFIFVFQDVRGKFRSEGEFVVMRPYVPSKSGKSVEETDESTDNYDTIEWLLQNVENNNGRVGQYGVSYPGFQTVMGMIDAHPALKASSPQASPSDMFLGDDWHHNGAFRLMYAFSWLSSNARVRDGIGTEREKPFDYGTPDGYRFFLDLGPIANVNERYFDYTVPTWNEFMEHGTYDDYWKEQVVLPHLNDIEHPILNVGGWFDAEDFYGPMSIYYEIEERNPKNESVLVVGPWLHGGWNRMDGSSLGNVQFESKTAHYFQTEIHLPFFRHHLKEAPDPRLPEAYVFETGSNVWRKYADWPPPGAVTKKLYLRESEGLSFDPPTGEGFDSYVSDPDKPVPFSAETRTTQGHLWMIEDQRFAASRPDVLVYESDVLAEDVTIAGPVIAHLEASTTGTDSDFVVKLIDVFPGTFPDNAPNPAGVRMGHFQMLLAGEVFRAKFRKSFERPEAMMPGEITSIEFDLRDRNHTFEKGHRIMVHVQSTWFPVIDRNPQTFVDIYKAQEEDFREATQRIYRSAAKPSYIRVNVIPSGLREAGSRE
ncbi:MAG TPA: CocE/NonD family hydrolase, partial [Vicinamibacteria bacterium]|nr:CocE/NonD family hydrolase [Vicinamibacteria bacterium]